jgi:hypothetical protein
MKRKLIYAASVVIMALAFTACETLTDCENCQLITYNSSGGVVDEGVSAEYCGAALITFKAANPDVYNPVTQNTTKLECN